MKDYYQNKIFKTFESFNQTDPWDEEELGDVGGKLEIFNKQYNLLKRLYMECKHFDNEFEKTISFLKLAYDLIINNILNEKTLKFFISWENLNTTAVINFFKGKQNNIVTKTILGDMVVNMPRPKNWEDVVMKKF